MFISANTLCFLKCLHSCVLVVRCRLLLFTPVYPYKALHVLGGRRRREIAKETFDVSLGVGCEAITQQGFRGQIDFPGNLFPAEMRSVDPTLENRIASYLASRARSIAIIQASNTL